MTTQMPFSGWGDPARRTGLPPHARGWLRTALGVHAEAPARTPAAPGPLPAPSTDLTPLRAVTTVDDSDAARLTHAGGKSYLDLLRARAGDAGRAPDAVLLPANDAEVAAALAVCRAHQIPVVPFGGGTSVVSGINPGRGAVVMDLQRMDALLAVDPTSLTATFQPGVRGPAADALLAPHGLRLGHLPQSYEYATIGGFVATRSAGQASTGFGRIDDMVLAVTLVTPAGVMRVGRGARSAAGPDLRALVMGSEGAFGVITEVTLRVRRIPDRSHYEGRLVRSFEAGRDLLRTLEQAGAAPDVARLSDPQETAVQLTLSAGGWAGMASRAYVRARAGQHACLLILGWEGDVARRRAHAAPYLRGTARLGAGAGDRWRHGRFDGPYLRDDLLDAGVLVETLETSATWQDLDQVRAQVRAALEASLGRCVVMCHVSHLYPQGASLYFTVLAAATTGPAGRSQWEHAKAAATDALMAAGGTVTHHHGVGADHRRWLPAEIGDLGLEVLRAVKGVLDPTGICNPGTLL